MLIPSLQAPAIDRSRAFPVILSPNTNANFSRVIHNLVPTNTIHFNPNNRAVVTTPNEMVPVRPAIPAVGIPLKPMIPSDLNARARNISKLEADDMVRLTQPTAPKEKTGLKDIPSEAMGARFMTGSKPGLCPARQCTAQHLAQQIRMCHSDLNCQAVEKCCDDPCWGIRTCTFPVPQTSTQVCPPQTPCTDRTYKVVCSSDQECSSSVGSKCCMDQCLGMWVCKHPILSSTPVDFQPWQPPITPPVQPPPLSNKCKRYCPGTLECCDSVLHVGFCPSSSLCYSAAQAAAFQQDLTSCAADQDCRASEKCCVSRCLKRMVCLPHVNNPEFHPGNCPAISSGCNMNLERNLDRCTNDRQCYLFQRCCPSSCFPGQSLCKDSFGEFTKPNSTQPDSQCTNYCPGSKLCCDQETKPGYCPRTRLCSGTVIPAPICSSDSNCRDDWKCCPNSCTGFNECSAAVSSLNDHAGFCPDKNCSSVVPPTGTLNQCIVDVDCYMHQKCCPDCLMNYNCETALSAPFSKCRLWCPDKISCCDGKEKTGFCPAKGTCRTGSSGLMKTCNEDYECPDSSKCCHDECLQSKICHLPASAPNSHPGSCPSTPCGADSAKFICHHDSDCYTNERCCMTGMGRQECQRTNCTGLRAYGAPAAYAPPVFPGRQPKPRFYPSPQYAPAPPSMYASIPSSNKYPSYLPPNAGFGTSLNPMKNPGVPQNLLPSPPRQHLSGSPNYPAASQPFPNRYTPPNSQGYGPQISLPQIPESLLSSSNRHVGPRSKQRPKHYRSLQSIHTNPKNE
ncbi:WAP-type 'four-disulfide core' domain [Trinorchestia longiramus]|nr:WAP-type 'four-disulfide core' domain [Trinorchestia longiramus]